MEIEEIYESLNLVVEEATGNIIGKLKFQFVKAGKENINRNKRYYSENLIQKVISKFNTENAGIAGQVDHPDSGRTGLDKVSHVLTKLEYNPATKIGTAEAAILNTTSGKDMKVLIQQNLKSLGASMRGVGEIEKDGKVKEDNYQFNTIDLVLNPSFKNASVDSSNLFESGNQVLKEAEKKNIIPITEFNERVEKIARHAFFDLLPMEGAKEEDFQKYLEENFQKYADAVETEIIKAGKTVEKVKEKSKKLTENEKLEVEFNEAVFAGYPHSFDEFKKSAKK